MSSVLRWCRAVSSCLTLVTLSLLLGGTPARAHAQGGSVTPLCVSGCLSYHVSVTPDGDTTTVAPGESYSTTFTVTNNGTEADTYTLACSDAGGVTCGSVSPSSVALAGTGSENQLATGGMEPNCFNCGGGNSATVTVHYTTAASGSTSGTLTLTATGSSSDGGTLQVALAFPPTVTFVSPGSGTRAVVHTRTPRLLALFTPSTAPLDTAGLTVTWRGQEVRRYVRFNRGLLEWPVDSARGLNGTGADSAQFAIHLCGTDGGCTTATQWVVLPNDDAPLVSFTSMPLEALGSAYTTTLGGFGVSGVEVGTAVGTPSYVSMGVARSAGLVYSTRQSWPRAMVNADLELRWPTGTPDRLKVVLTGPGWGGVTIRFDSLVVDNPTCQTGSGTVRRCRVALQASYAGTPFPTPTPKWLTIETTVTDGSVSQMTSDSVEVVMVDRRSTPYGSGWWPAGVSQLVGSGNDRILVGASGAATIFRGNGDSLYLSPPGSFTTLVKTTSGWELRPRGSLARVRFDTYGRYVASVDVSGNRDSVAYVGAGGTGQAFEVSQLIDPVGKSFTFSYTTAGVLSGISDGTRTSTVTIDSATNALTAFAPPAPTGQDLTSHFGYNVYGGVHTVLIARRWSVLGDTVALSYNALYRPTGATLPQVEDETGTLVHPTVSYAAAELRGDGTFRGLDSAYVEVRGPLGHWTRALLNRWGSPTISWDTLGTLSRVTYTPTGLPLTTENVVGDSSRVYTDYDTLSRPVRTYIFRGDTTVAHRLRLDSLVYDANSRVIRSVDPMGRVSQVDYDAVGRPIRSITPHNDTTITWYRADGLVYAVQAPGIPVATRYSYDATWKNLIKVIDPQEDTLVVNTLDSYGRVSHSDRRAPVRLATGTTLYYEMRRTENFYNVANAVDSTRTMRSDSFTCSSTCGSWSWPAASDTLRTRRVAVRYDSAGRAVKRLNDRGIATLYSYDRLGRLVSRRPWADSSAVKDSTVYDVAGNVKKTITRRGYTITSNYDVRNRDTLTVIPTVGTIRKAYGGPAGQLTRVWVENPVDSIGNVGDELRWGYDLRGRLKADTSYLLASSGSPQVTTHGYDFYERDSVRTDRLGTWQTGYEASRGMANRLITPYADTVTYTFDNLGRASEPTIRNGGLKVSGQRIWKFNRSLGTDSIFAYGPSGSYVVGLYDRADADTGYQALAPEWSEQQGAGTTAIAWKDSVTYDGWNRLAGWTLLRNGVPWATDSGYTFDRNGNVSQATAATYDGTTDRLTGRAETGGTRTFTYDRDGNLITSTSPGGVVLSGEYDALDRLVAVRQNGTLIARYGYDVLGRRVAKRVYSSASGGTVGTTRYTYRGSNVLYESDAAGTVTRSYTWGGTNRLLAFHEGSAHYYVIADRLGSVRSILGADGSWLMSQRFTPYGARQSVDSAGSYPALPYGWTGREYDAETGFYYLRARYYMPLLRRFVQPDPAGYGGGSNLYAYVGGDPLEAIDPTGRQALEPASYTPWDGTEMALFGRHLSGGGGSGWDDPSFWGYGSFWDNGGALGYADIPINDLDQYAAMESRYSAAERDAAIALESHRRAMADAIDRPIFDPLLLVAGPEAEIEDEAVTLYRAVGSEEFEQLGRELQLKMGPSSIAEGKFFATSYADAAKWGEWFTNAYNDLHRVVEVRFPRSVVDRGLSWDRLDGIGPAIMIKATDLWHGIVNLLH